MLTVPGSGAAEQRIAFSEEISVGLEAVGARHVNAPALEGLQPRSLR
jgi:hypothetical protein